MEAGWQEKPCTGPLWQAAWRPHRSHHPDQRGIFPRQRKIALFRPSCDPRLCAPTRRGL